MPHLVHIAQAEPRLPASQGNSARQSQWASRLTRAAALLLGLCTVAGCRHASEVANAPLVWAADEEGGAPYVFKAPHDLGRRIGFEVDLAELLAAELGRKIEFRQYAYASLVPGLQRGDFDFAMNGLEVTPDRRQVVRFTHPYYIYSLEITARANDRRFESLAECQRLGLMVGTLEDTAAERLLDELGIRKKIYDSQAEPYRDLAMGRLDAVLMDQPIAVYYARPDKALRTVGPPIRDGHYAIAVRQDNEPLARQLDEALARLVESGSLRKIYQKWNLWNEKQEQLGADVGDVLQTSQRLWTIGRYLPYLLAGAATTIGVTFSSMALAMAIGLPIALARLYGAWPLRFAAAVYVEFFRGVPVLLLLYFLYYGLPALAEFYALPFALNLGPLPTAVLGFGLNYAAYEAEIYRAGIRSIPSGQWEAAASLGMTHGLTFRRIILPQAIRVILPPMTNDLVALFKDTSIVSVIAVVELTKQYLILSKSSLKYFEIGLVTALLYLLMSVPLGYLSRRLEQRWGKGL